MLLVYNGKCTNGGATCGAAVNGCSAVSCLVKAVGGIPPANRLLCCETSGRMGTWPVMVSTALCGPAGFAGTARLS